MKTSTFVTIIIVILVILGGAWYFYSTHSTTPAPDTTSQTATPAGSDTTTASTTSTDTGMQDNGVVVGAGAGVSSAPMTATVHLTSSGFSPAQVTVAKGATVTFINDTTSGMWVASDAHPSHTDYDGTSRTTHCAPGYTGPKPFDQCGNGTQFSFTFDKVGSIDFHNHLRASEVGVVVVQ